MSAVYLRKYEKFLEAIPLSRYSTLRKIKTVEQDLPKALNPLPMIYKFYWEEKQFIDYETFFENYWELNIKHILKFIEKFFYGCSLSFVKEGFKARIYRTWVSLLTQFHFQYLWLKLFNGRYPLEASAELDLLGIDSKISFMGKRIGIQIKKISFRREASQRKFTKRQKKVVDIICEIPYLVINEDELYRKLGSKRTRATTKEKIEGILFMFKTNFRKLENGFVIFADKYLTKVEEEIRKNILTGTEFIPYNVFLEVE